MRCVVAERENGTVVFTEWGEVEEVYVHVYVVAVAQSIVLIWCMAPDVSGPPTGHLRASAIHSAFLWPFMCSPHFWI